MNKGIVDSSIGKVYINKKVLAQYAGYAAIQTSGVVGMAMRSVKDGFYKLLKKDSLEKGVEINVEENQLCIDFHIIALYGVHIPNIAESIIETVSYEVELFTGMKVKEINVYVEGLKIID